MNRRLVDALNKGMQVDNREEIRQILIDSDPELLGVIHTLPTNKIIQLACEYVAVATNQYVNEKITFDSLIIGTDINEGVKELANNPAIINYTQAVMILTAALCKND